MSRIDDLTARMVATMPLPAPESGPRFSRVRLWAKAVVDEEAQTGNAVEQLKMPATLTRTDTVWNGAAWVAVDATIPANWDEANSATWRFSAADDAPGAAGVFLDQWGRNLQVPRYGGELDQSYARRMVEEVISPSTTNMGLAALIDRLLGTTGTRVLEGESFFTSIRLNDGHRLNSGKRLMGFGGFGAESLWNTFVVVLPAAMPDVSSQEQVVALIDRRRGAGNRLLAIVSDGRAPQVVAVAAVPVNQAYTARVAYPEGGATYTWTITNGTITSGQGTDTITVQPAAVGMVKASVLQSGGLGNGKTGSRETNAIASVIGTITVDTVRAPAGETGHRASVPARQDAIYEWVATNGYILSGQGTNSIVFGLGEAEPVLGAQTHIVCTITVAGTPVQVIGEAWVDILPFPYTYTHTTTSLAPGSSELFTMDLGKHWLVKEIASDIPVRVRIYESAAARTADANRAAGTAPVGDHGLLCEAVTTLSQLDIPFSPWAYGVTPTNQAFVSITNTGVARGTATVTIKTQMNEV
jgi:hypothetical protein